MALSENVQKIIKKPCLTEADITAVKKELSQALQADPVALTAEDARKLWSFSTHFPTTFAALRVDLRMKFPQEAFV